MGPQARQDNLLVQDVMDELVVYDQKRHRVHTLNRTSALVWRHCDGRTTVAEMATLLQSELNLPADEEVVWWALRKLGRAHLLRERLIRPAAVAGITRREAIRKLRVAGIAAGIAAGLLPVVTSIVAPTPANAATKITM